MKSVLVLAVLYCVLPALFVQAAQAAPADAAPAGAALTPEQFQTLAEAYQSGYLQLAAASALQVHSSTGVLATAFSQGQLDGPAAMEALSDNSLLHGVAYMTLLEIQQATPKDDATAHAQLGALAAVLVQEQELINALSDVFSTTTDANAQRVNQARERVEQALDKLLEE